MRAFISSTVADLTEYRQTVQDVLRNLGIEYVTLDGLLDPDGPAESVRTRILDELSRSDVVLLIIGHRYGSIDRSSGVGWVEADTTTNGAPGDLRRICESHL